MEPLTPVVRSCPVCLAPMQAQGQAWEVCLGQLAEAAGAHRLRDALPRRRELLPPVEGLAPGDPKGHAAVVRLAQDMGLR